jgi:hypothetical protein
MQSFFGSLFRWLVIPYSPHPEMREFTDKAVIQQRENLEVRAAVLDGASSRKFFGVPMARRGIQPTWIHIINNSTQPYRLQFVAVDPNYFSPLEASAVNHYSSGKRLLGFGLMAWLFFLPLALVLPIKLFSVRRANRKMDAFFLEHAFRMRPIAPGEEQSGFVYTNLSEGTKVVLVRLLGPDGSQEFEFSLPVQGLDADHLRRDFREVLPVGETTEKDIPDLRQYLEAAPMTTTNSGGRRSGDPVNLVVIGNFPRVLGAFGARWDETEVISMSTCWKTFRAFLTGGEYRYSPVSSLFLYGRQQDFALQRIRNTINERLHLRLWALPIQFRGQRVWIGQVSRDIGVRLTWRTWNLTTHRIDPDVDEARDYVVEDLMQVGRIDIAGYVEGVGSCDRASARRNLTGDPYYTDGKRAVVFLSETRASPRFIALT